MTDAIITWVNGNDPDHQKRKEDRRLEMNSEPASEALKETRFSSHDEIRYCLRSIYNHAPWIKRIFLITDDQFPSSIDKLKAEKFGIYQISHREIFHGYEHFLPTFNSRSIENMMFRIKGLSDSFIYLNDDMFFVSRSKKKHFFEENGTPKIYATKRPLPENSDNLYVDGLVKATKVVNSNAPYYLWPSHFAYPLNVKAFLALRDELGQKFCENAAYPFRRIDQFQPVSGIYAQLHWKEGKKLRQRSRLFGLEISEGCSKKPLKKHGLRKVLLEKGVFNMCCINDWANAETKIPGVLKSLKKAIGPAAPFEN